MDDGRHSVNVLWLGIGSFYLASNRLAAVCLPVHDRLAANLFPYHLDHVPSPALD